MADHETTNDYTRLLDAAKRYLMFPKHSASCVTKTETTKLLPRVYYDGMKQLEKGAKYNEVTLKFD